MNDMLKPANVLKTKLTNGVISWREFLLGRVRALVHEIIQEHADGSKTLFWVMAGDEDVNRVAHCRFLDCPMTDEIYGPTYGTEEDKARRAVCQKFMREFGIR